MVVQILPKFGWMIRMSMELNYRPLHAQGGLACLVAPSPPTHPALAIFQPNKKKKESCFLRQLD